MPAAVTIEIGGIAFGVRCETAELLPTREPYAPFATVSHPDADVIPVTVLDQSGVIPRSGKRLFTCPAWTMTRTADRYIVDLDPSGSPGTSDYHAIFDPDMSAITVCCSGRFARPDPAQRAVNNPFCYPLDQILLMYALAARGGVIIHASGVNLDGRGYLFSGRSGAGKSTLSRLFAASGGSVLSDDRVAVRPAALGYRAWGTPWAGTAGLAVNERLPLRGIVFIHHGNENRVHPLSPAEAVRRLFTVASIPWFDAPAMMRVLDVCEDLVNAVPAFEMHFKPGPEATAFFRETVLLEK